MVDPIVVRWNPADQPDGWGALSRVKSLLTLFAISMRRQRPLSRIELTIVVPNMLSACWHLIIPLLLSIAECLTSDLQNIARRVSWACIDSRVLL